MPPKGKSSGTASSPASSKKGGGSSAPGSRTSTPSKSNPQRMPKDSPIPVSASPIDFAALTRQLQQCSISTSQPPASSLTPLIVDSNVRIGGVKSENAENSVAPDPVVYHRTALRIMVSNSDAKARNLRLGDVVRISRVDENDQAVSDRTDNIGVVWPAPGIAESRAVMSSLLRQNAKLEVGSRVVLGLLDHPIQEAERVILTPTADIKFPFDQALVFYAQEILIDLKFVTMGGCIEFHYQGFPKQFKVDKVRPLQRVKDVLGEESLSRIFQVTQRTAVSFRPLEESPKKSVVGLSGVDSVGGLQKEIEAVKKLVASSLVDHSKFDKLGLRPPRGVLLHGPPGTGKTLIARAVAAEFGAHVVVVNGPEVISKYYGETEEKLRMIFEEAVDSAPSIIFIDEIDALCPKRDDSASDLEKRIVAQLLTLMDGAHAKRLGMAHDRVVILAATNRPNAIDEALRRPGRFDREIEIGIPDAPARLDILTRLLRKMPNTLNADDIARISSAAHGFVGADLSAVCREAGLLAVKRIKKAKDNGTEEGLEVEVKVHLTEMLEALGKVRPTSMREILLEIPRVLWTDIGGQEDIKQKLKEAVEWPLKHPEAFQRFNIKPPKGILLYGPPGCSKTLMAKALATEAGLNFLAVKGPELFSKWVGDSEKAIRDVFKKARAASPSIVFFDEIDAIGVRRGQDGDGGVSVGDRVLSQLLNELDGIEPLVNVTVVAATNRPDILDSALLRPGRIDRILLVSPPDFASRAQIFRMRIRNRSNLATNGQASGGKPKMTCADDVDIEELAKMTEGYSGAEVVAVCQEAAMAAMEEDINAQKASMSHFHNALVKVKPRITGEMLKFYEDFANRSGLARV